MYVMTNNPVSPLLGHEGQKSVRKALEAFYCRFHHSKDPQFNRKWERMYATRELKLHLSLAF